MAKVRKDKRGRGGALTEEDARLWARVTETAEPLSPRARAAARAKSTAPVKEAGSSEPKRARAEPDRVSTPKPFSRAVPPLAPFDAREARRIGGRFGIDARIDLHGLRQQEAYRRLKAFLVAAQARGARRVLVITGKGGGMRDDARPFWDASDRGVLKRLVPQWLAEPELRPLVVGFTTAQARHGGEGALYVRLRKAR